MQVIDYPALEHLDAAAYAAYVNDSLYIDGKVPVSTTALQDLLELYPPSANTNSTLAALENQAAWARYGTDAGMVCPMTWIAQAAAANKHTAVHSYQWNYTWPNQSCSDLYFAPEYGITHTAEVPYVFGMPTYLFGAPIGLASDCTMSAIDSEFALAIGDMWTNLHVQSARQHWPEYNQTDMLRIVLQPRQGESHFQVKRAWRENICRRLYTILYN